MNSKSATGNCLFLPDRLYENGHNFFVRTPNEVKRSALDPRKRLHLKILDFDTVALKFGLDSFPTQFDP
ncbi:hypothetical protein H5410_020950 [Solanum commersonii]|uniref:Uncharacterized protein n=1 Tax=Solanum commersonii TaxID=4109 RepID=A0A9J5ZBC0_SOLCO|nr:hypothetical protein H5410_020950 [Solanum commersonii]